MPDRIEPRRCQHRPELAAAGGSCLRPRAVIVLAAGHAGELGHQRPALCRGDRPHLLRLQPEPALPLPGGRAQPYSDRNFGAHASARFCNPEDPTDNAVGDLHGRRVQTSARKARGTWKVQARSITGDLLFTRSNKPEEFQMRSAILAALAISALSATACTIQPPAPAATPVIVTAPAPAPAPSTSTIVVPRAY